MPTEPEPEPKSDKVEEVPKPAENGKPKPAKTTVSQPSEAGAPRIESATSFVNVDLLRDFEARILISGNPRPVVTWSSGPTCGGKPENTITTGGRYTVGLQVR